MVNKKIKSVAYIHDLAHYELTGQPVVLTMQIDTFDGRATIESNVAVDPFGLIMALMSNKHFNKRGYLGQVLIRTDNHEDGHQNIAFHHMYDDKTMLVGNQRLVIRDGRTYRIENVTIEDVKRIALSLDPTATDLISMHPKKIRRILSKLSGFHYVKYAIV